MDLLRLSLSSLSKLSIEDWPLAEMNEPDELSFKQISKIIDAWWRIGNAEF